MEKEYERLKYESMQFEKDKNHEILQLNNDIKDLAKKLEDRQNERNNLQSTVEASNNDASSKNLNLGRILMAIDNLYNRCLDGTQRIRHDFEDNRAEKGKADQKEKKGDKKDKKGTKEKFEKKDQTTEDDEDNYEAKSKLAAAKLKSIALYMNDFKKIIDACKAEMANKPKEVTKKQ